MANFEDLSDDILYLIVNHVSKAHVYNIHYQALT